MDYAIRKDLETGKIHVNLEAIHMLLDSGFDVNAKNQKGNIIWHDMLEIEVLKEERLLKKLAHLGQKTINSTDASGENSPLQTWSTKTIKKE